MMRKNISRKEALIISCVILVSFHIVSIYQKRSWNNLLDDPQPSIPSRVNDAQEASLAYRSDNKELASNLRTKELSGSVETMYNLGTARAQWSVTSGTVTDYTGLQEAELLLSGAAILDTTANVEIIHNLETVRNLLKKEEQQQENKQQQESGGSGDEQQEQNQEGSGEQQDGTQQQGGKDGQSQEAGPGQQASKLSENMKQQLEQYQQQLAGEQAQNQQFFDKQNPQAGQNDPFDMLNQVFGGQPQFDKQNSNPGEKDW